MPLRTLVRADLPKRPFKAEQILHEESAAVLQEWSTTPGFSTFQ
jgi:hypothetical protein